jgi:lipoprotein NlpI
MRLFPLLLTLSLCGAVSAQDEPASPRALIQAGQTAFFDARIDDSVAAFDKLIALAPTIKPQLWQRGLSIYYKGDYKAGREQFESHQTYNTNDVENAAWHFICVARAENVEAARKALIPIEGDGRVPMKEVHDLFAGKGSPEAVLKAAATEDEEARRNHLCYAHLYLGLYFEALGDDTRAKDHILKAATDYRMDHYMGKCAQVHARVRGWLKAPQ